MEGRLERIICLLWSQGLKEICVCAGRTSFLHCQEFSESRIRVLRCCREDVFPCSRRIYKWITIGWSIVVGLRFTLFKFIYLQWRYLELSSPPFLPRGVKKKMCLAQLVLLCEDYISHAYECLMCCFFLLCHRLKKKRKNTQDNQYKQHKSQVICV